MTEQEIRKLLNLIKHQNLFCNINLATCETYLLGNIVIYSALVANVYADEEKDDSVITLQIDLDPTGGAYYFNDTSGACDKEIKEKAFPVVQYCKNLIQKYM